MNVCPGASKPSEFSNIDLPSQKALPSRLGAQGIIGAYTGYAES
jgi:hypothetical protein